MPYNTIPIKKYTHIHDEKLAAAAITPGMLVSRTAADQVTPHATAGGENARLFALEDENQGREIGTAYAIGELVKVWHAQPGEQVYAIADDTASGAIVVGDRLESNGNGRLRKLAAGVPLAVALDAVTPGPTSPRFVVEIL